MKSRDLTTKILFWNGPKGIDDALRENVSLRSLTISEWHQILAFGHTAREMLAKSLDDVELEFQLRGSGDGENL
jgi:hypothetical protein